MPPTDSNPPCGEPNVNQCPGPEITLNRHTHTDMPPEADRHSFGVGVYAKRNPGTIVLRVDAALWNWCSTCQSQLLICYRQFHCLKARSEAVAMAHLAAYITVAKAEGDSYSEWSSTQNEAATEAAYKRAMWRLNGPKSDPARWKDGWHPSSLVNWFGSYGGAEVRTALGGVTDEPTFDPDNRHEFDRLSQPIPPPESQVIRHEENQHFTQAWADIVDRMLDAVVAIPIRGNHAHTPTTVLLVYLAQFTAWEFRNDDRFGPERRNDRQAARQLGLGDTGNKTIGRIREHDIVPALSALLLRSAADDPANHAGTDAFDSVHEPLSPEEASALRTFLAYLGGRTPTLKPPLRAS